MLNLRAASTKSSSDPWSLITVHISSNVEFASLGNLGEPLELGEANRGADEEASPDECWSCEAREGHFSDSVVFCEGESEDGLSEVFIYV